MASWGGKSFSRLRETMPPPAAQAATRSRPLLPRRSTWGCPAGREFRAPSGGSDDLASRTGLPLAGSGRCVAGAPWWLLAGPVQALGGQAGVAGVRVHPPPLCCALLRPTTVRPRVCSFLCSSPPVDPVCLCLDLTPTKRTRIAIAEMQRGPLRRSLPAGSGQDARSVGAPPKPTIGGALSWMWWQS